MKKIFVQSRYILLFFFLIVTGCKKHALTEVNPDASGGVDIFVSATPTGSYSSAELKTFATLKGYGSYAPLIQYGVDFYKLIYKTTYNGMQIEASGLLCIPQNTPAAPPLLSAQHGTTFTYADAPSNFPLTSTGLEIFASAGFVTVIPDFIGLGASKSIPQPYYDMKTSASAVVDMLKAVKYYLKTQNKAISNKLFLLGYSEGGYVTMAAQKEIETNPADDLTVTAAAEGAGGYDLMGMLNQIADASTYPDPSFLALLIQGYDVTYKWNRPLTDFFMPVYATAIPGLLDGTKTSGQVNSALSTSTKELFNGTFYANLDNPFGETAFKAQLVTNSFPGWYPKSPTRLYHGTADKDVFFQTTQTTYNKFIAAGAPHLTLIPIPNGTHENSVQPMLLDAIPWFKSLE